MWKWNRKQFWDLLRLHRLQLEKLGAHWDFWSTLFRKTGTRHAHCGENRSWVCSSPRFKHPSFSESISEKYSRSTYQGKFVQRIFRMRDQGVASSSSVQAWAWVLGRSLRKNLASLNTWEPEEILLGQRGKELRREEEKLEVKWKSLCSYQGFSILAFLTSWVG